MKEHLWVEKYRPRRVDDIILPEGIKRVLKGHVESGDLSNLLLVGPAGVGKTTAARAMVDELKAESFLVNSSLSRNIDMLRDEIAGFASSISFEGGRKYVILDEADGLNPQSTQPALRGFIEEFSNNCGFILTANFREKLLEPLRSRLAEVNFQIPKSEKPALALEFMGRIKKILETEGVQYDSAAVAGVIKKHIPDWRRILNELQNYAKSGHIDSGILTQLSDELINQLLAYVKDKNFSEVRKWVAENDHISSSELFRSLYDRLNSLLETKSIPAIVLILAKYGYQSAFVADQQINTAACLVEVMVEAKFK
jgi:DNA polymerase III delta prime subunit